MTTERIDVLARHVIEIKPNGRGTYDVLMNAVSYRIHRNLSAADAEVRALDIQRSLRAIGERAAIYGPEE